MSKVLNANILLYGLHKQNLLEIYRMILIASEKLSSVKIQLISIYNDVEYEPSKFQELTTKLKAILKESIYVKKKLSDLFKRYK